MNAKELLADMERTLKEGEFAPSELDDANTLLRALRLLAAAERNDGSTPETDAAIAWSNDRGWPAGTHPMVEILSRMATIERERNGLAARVGELERDAARYRYLRSRDKDEVFNHDGVAAGVWIDCTAEDGTLQLLTEEDADGAIDAAREGK